MPHIKRKNPSVLRLCPFDVTNLSISEVCPLRIPDSHPWLLLLGNSSVSSAWWPHAQGFVKVTAWIRHTWAAELLKPLADPEEEEELGELLSVSCCTASSPGQTLLSQYLTGGGSRTDISSLSEGQYAMRKKKKANQLNSSGGFS